MDAEQWQIASTVVQAASAVVLVGITGWYAYLTKRLAESAAAQAAASAQQIEAAEQRALEAHDLMVKRALASMQRAGAALERLPTTAEDSADSKLRNAPLWETSTVSSIERIGLQLAVLDDDDVAQLAEDMSWLLRRVREVRRVSTQAGFDYSKFEWDEWTERISRSRDLLANSVSILKDFQQQSAEA